MNNINDLYVHPSKAVNAHNLNKNVPSNQNSMKGLQNRSVLYKKGPTAISGVGAGGVSTDVAMEDRAKINIADNSKGCEFLEPKHLELLDLNTNIESMLPPVTKPVLNLETVCKATTKAQTAMHSSPMNVTNNNMRNLGINNINNMNNLHNMNHISNLNNANAYENNIYRNCQLQTAENVKHLYEMDTPQIVGTYINQINKNNTNSMSTCSINNSFNNLNTNMPLPASPFFQPPTMNMSQQFIPPTNNYLPFNFNKNTNLYGLSPYLIPEAKPQSLTVTTIPNKDKDILEQEAKQLKLLLDSSSQGVVNSNPDYQTISPSALFSSDEGIIKEEANEKNSNSSNNCDSNNINSNNDRKSDFSFGKQENIDSFDDDFNNSGDKYMENPHFNETLHNESHYENMHISKNKQYEMKQMDDYMINSSYSNCSNNDRYYHLEIDELNKIKNEIQPDTFEQFQDSENYITKRNERENKDNNDDYENKSGSQKREYSTTNSFKTYEPSTCFKNSKRYINIRLGRPKYPYVTNSADPIDKKLKDWHNSHNSQIKWKKNKRGVYLFGKTEIVLSIVHDKIIVKKIDGKQVKDNLLTVEKFVSLNELNELEREELENNSQEDLHDT